MGQSCCKQVNGDHVEIVDDMAKPLAERKCQVDDSKPRVLFVSDKLPLFELLIKATKDSTMVVPVNYEQWTLKQLVEETVKRLGEPGFQYTSIAFMDHGVSGAFKLLKSVGDENGMVSLPVLEGNHQLQDFFKFLTSYLVKKTFSADFEEDLSRRFDLLACEVAKGEGIKLIEFLEDITETCWAASDNKTGNTRINTVNTPADWVMQTKAGLGAVHGCYFQIPRLAKWDYKCATGVYDYVPVVGHLHYLMADDKDAQAIWDKAQTGTIVGFTAGACAAAAPVAAATAGVVAGGGIIAGAGLVGGAGGGVLTGHLSSEAKDKIVAGGAAGAAALGCVAAAPVLAPTYAAAAFASPALGVVGGTTVGAVMGGSTHYGETAKRALEGDETKQKEKEIMEAGWKAGVGAAAEVKDVGLKFAGKDNFVGK